MGKTQTTVLCLIILVFAAVHAQKASPGGATGTRPAKKCQGNESYVMAMMTEMTCENRKPKPIIPIWECRCNLGLLRYQQKCVKPEACTMVCDDPNEEHIVVNVAETTCDSRNFRPISPTKECRCKQGYIRFGKACIPLEKCPAATCKDPNEEYTLVSFTESTCSDEVPKGITPVRRCRCKIDFVRHGGRCIHKTHCPRRCSRPNEGYVVADHTEPTCSDSPTIPIHPLYQCRCLSGFVRNNGRCIDKTECPDNCKDPNEVLVLAKFSEPICQRPIAYRINAVRECRCKNGYIRWGTKCVPISQCPTKCPGPNENYVITRFTEPTCEQTRPTDMRMLKYGCRCKSDYFRFQGRCVKRSECPKPK